MSENQNDGLFFLRKRLSQESRNPFIFLELIEVIEIQDG